MSGAPLHGLERGDPLAGVLERAREPPDGGSVLAGEGDEPADAHRG
jgi:hypothetical protein